MKNFSLLLILLLSFTLFAQSKNAYETKRYTNNELSVEMNVPAGWQLIEE